MKLSLAILFTVGFFCTVLTMLLVPNPIAQGFVYFMLGTLAMVLRDVLRYFFRPVEQPTAANINDAPTLRSIIR